MKPDDDTNAVEVTGTLKFADSRKRTNEIQIVSIVKPLWEEEVTVTGVHKGRKIILLMLPPPLLADLASALDWGLGSTPSTWPTNRSRSA